MYNTAQKLALAVDIRVALKAAAKAAARRVRRSIKMLGSGRIRAMALPFKGARFCTLPF